MFKSIEWSEEFQPCDTCRYNHVIGKTPFGGIMISWKGHKDYPAFDAELDWGTCIHGSSLEETKQACEEDYQKRLQACYLPVDKDRSEFLDSVSKATPNDERISELVASSRSAKGAPFLSRYKSGVSSIAPEFNHEKVSTLEDLNSLEESLVVAGYKWGLDNSWEPESSRSFWHGWRNAQIDRGRIPPDTESISLARAVVDILNERLTSKS